MRPITKENGVEDSSKVYNTFLIFNLIKPKRKAWHRHYYLRCKYCKTYLLVYCDRLGDIKCEERRTLSLMEKPHSKRGIKRVPDEVKKALKEFKWDDCTKHFTK